MNHLDHRQFRMLNLEQMKKGVSGVFARPFGCRVLVADLEYNDEDPFLRGRHIRHET